MVDIILILALAIIIDLAFGEPPDVLHPVAWIGKVIAFLERAVINRRPVFQFIYGVVMALSVVILFTAAAYFLLAYLEGVSSAAYIIVGALLLKLTFSFTGLKRTALKIAGLLKKESMDGARFELRSLVSRDTRNLPQPLLVSATVESVAESTCDSLVAPLFYFLLFGVPGAVAFRIVSTFDSMIGYHGKYEYLGKFASRLDDVLNYIPARLSGLLLVLAVFFSGGDVQRSWRVMMRDHSRTESPNAGWPMAAMAGALDVQLEKPGHYKLGRASAPLVPQTIATSLRLMGMAAASWLIVLFALGVLNLVSTA